MTSTAMPPYYFTHPRVYNEPDALSNEARLKGLIASTVFFAVLFAVSWPLLVRFWPRFRTYSVPIQADNASRVCSTFHAAVVCPLILHGILTTQWGPHMVVTSNTYRVQIPMIFSMGYFISDFFVLFYYRTPRWQIFMFHHTFAVVPYMSYLFSSCNYSVFVVVSYLLVETSTTIFNVKQWMDDCKLTSGALYTYVMYASCLSWVVFRLLLPAYMVYISYFDVVPDLQGKPLVDICTKPSLVCGFLVNLFCQIAFWTILFPQVYQRWTKPKRA